MSALISPPEDPQRLVEATEPVIECVSQPVLITEQAVAFSTAAVVRLPRAKPSHKLIAALRAMFLTSEGPPPAQRHYLPRREAFLEDPAMDREMHRL